jgi:hypothetical protein
MDYYLHNFGNTSSTLATTDRRQYHHNDNDNDNSINMPQHYDYHNDNDDSQHDIVSSSSSDLVDKVIRTSKVCSSMLLEYCSLCTVYIDQQVQYELFAPAAATTSSSTNDSRPQRSDTQVFWDFVNGGLVNPTAVGVHGNVEDDDSHSMMSAGMARRSTRLSAALDMFDEDSVVESVEMRQ